MDLKELQYWSWGPDEMMPMDTLLAKAKESARIIREKTGLGDREIFAAVVLGSLAQDSLGGQLKIIGKLPYQEFMYFQLPETSAAGHKRVLELAELNGRIIMIWRGRPAHYYEGLKVGEVDKEGALLVGDQRKASCISWISWAMGAKLLVLTNAAGGPRRNQKKGTLVVGEGVYNINQRDPLAAIGGLGFFDPSRRYSRHLNDILSAICLQEGADVDRGITAAISGTAYEDDGMIRRLMMEDIAAAGMSVVNEKYVAAFLGLPAVSLTVITDLLWDEEHTTHEMVMAVSAAAQPLLDRIIPLLINSISEEDLQKAIKQADLYPKK